MIRNLCLAAVSTAMIVAAPAESQSRRELAERIDATEVRIGELEDSFLAGDPVAETLMRRLDALDYQMREVTSESERLRYENRQLRDEVDALRAELEAMRTPAEPAYDNATADFMSEGLDGTSDEAAADGEAVIYDDPNDPYAADRAAASGVLGASATQLPAAQNPDPDVVFQDALARLNDSDFAGAQAGFEAFLAANPDHPMVGQAQYRLGEAYFVGNQFGDAATAYIASLRADPEGERAPDALVRLAASLHALGRTQEACDTLARFGRQFPNAPQAARNRAARESVRANCR